MSDKKELDKIITGEFRVSFPAVFKPTSVNPTDEKKYGLTMLIPKTDHIGINKIKELLRRTLTAKHGPDKNKWPKKQPIRDGDIEYPERDGYPGHWFVACRNKTKPGLINASREAIIDESEFYAGCYARATLTAFCYDKGVNKGVALSLQNVQKLRDGEPFTSRAKAEDDFGPEHTPVGAVEEAEPSML